MTQTWNALSVTQAGERPHQSSFATLCPQLPPREEIGAAHAMHLHH